MINTFANLLYRALMLSFLFLIFKNTSPDLIISDGVNIAVVIFFGAVAGMTLRGNPK